MHTLRRSAALLCTGLLAGCGGNLTHTWQLDQGGQVTGALSSVSWVMGCSAGAPSTPSGAREVSDEALCGVPSLQLSLSPRGEGKATVEVREVRVRDAASGQLLGLRGARKPQRWAGSSYTPWDEVVTAGSGPLQVLYELSFPPSVTASPSGVIAPRGGAWGVRVEVDLVVNGVVGSLSFETLRHAPDVVS